MARHSSISSLVVAVTLTLTNECLGSLSQRLSTESAVRWVFATVSTASGTSPKFACNGTCTLPFVAKHGKNMMNTRSVHNANLTYMPLGANAVLQTKFGVCWVTGISRPGEYIVQVCQGSGLVDTVIKGIDLRRPVENLGAQSPNWMATSWTAKSTFDGDSVANMWQASNLDSAQQCTPSGVTTDDGIASLSGGCGLSTQSLEARTLNFFRFPFSVEVGNLYVDANSTLYVGIESPERAVMEATGWPSVHHYLPLVEPPSPKTNTFHGEIDGRVASLNGSTLNPTIAVTLSGGGDLKLWRRRVRDNAAELIGAKLLPASCGFSSSAASLELFAGSASTIGKSITRIAAPLVVTALVHCDNQELVNLTADLGVDFLDLGGFGDSVGEAVLAVRSLLPQSKTASNMVVRIGAVRVVNKLEPGIPPGVLAPLTDSNGILNWDHGTLGAWHDQEAKARGVFGPSEGLLDVTAPPFSADPTGRTDATSALQAAIDFSRDNYLTPWLPVGVYTITRSLRLIQRTRLASIGSAELNLTSNYCPQRFTTWAIRGEVSRSDAAGWGIPDDSGEFAPRQGRATLVVPPNTPAFGLQHGRSNSSVPVSVLNCSCVNANGELEPNVLMAMVVQSIDVVIGSGNPTAVGVRMRGAQGSSLEDVAVFAARDAFAGIAGVSGSGGAHSNLTVIGARIGLDARDTQPSATVSNLRLINQTCTSILHEGLETLTMAGVYVSFGPMLEPGAPVISTGSFLPGLPTTGACAALLNPATGVPKMSIVAGAVSIVDSVFECTQCDSQRALVASDRNVYLRRSVLRGVIHVAEIYNATGALVFTLAAPISTNGSLALDIQELSLPVPISPPTITSSAYTNGSILPPTLPHGPVIFEWRHFLLAVRDIADAMCDRHGWGDNVAFPTAMLPRHAMVNVKDYGAVGNGVRDDTAALQQAINSAAHLQVPVFFPRGVYRTCTSLLIHRGGQLLGLARHLVQIVATDIGFGTCAGNKNRLKQLKQLRRAATGGIEPDYGDVAPILFFSNLSPKFETSRAQHPSALVTASSGQRIVPSTRTVLVGSLMFGLSLFVPTMNTRSNASHWAFYAGVSTSGHFNVYRQSWQTRRPPCGEWVSGTCGTLRSAQVPYNAAYARIGGADATIRIFAFYQEDGVANNGLESQSPDSRKLLVNGTRGEIAIYQLNGEHSISTAYSEFVNTSGVAIYGCKSESSMTLSAVIMVKSSINFSSYGHGGAAHVSSAPIGPDSCNGMAPCPWNASLYRILDSENVRFVNLQGQFFAASSSMVFEVHDGVSVSSPNGEWPAIWFRATQESRL